MGLGTFLNKKLFNQDPEKEVRSRTAPAFADRLLSMGFTPGEATEATSRYIETGLVELPTERPTGKDVRTEVGQKTAFEFPTRPDGSNLTMVEFPTTEVSPQMTPIVPFDATKKSSERFTPEQIKALASGDFEAQKTLFPGGIPGDVVSQALISGRKDRFTPEQMAAILQGDKSAFLSTFEKGATKQAMDVFGKSRERALEESKPITAKSRVTSNLVELKNLYETLGEMAAIPSTEGGAISNVKARLSASDIGQSFGRAVGASEQNIRDQINQIRPLLLNDIRQASEMGARGLDSEKELEFYLQAATDPKRLLETNLAALNVLDRAYGLGLGVSENINAENSLKREFSSVNLPNNQNTPSFNSVEEAEASGYKGPAIVAGRKAVIE